MILDTGETKEITGEQNIAEILNPNECYLLFDDIAKIIWLWKGTKARIRSKFIGAKKSQELRGQVGLMNKVISIDEGEEPDEFLVAIGEPPRSGVAKEIRAEEVMAPNPSQAPPSWSSSANGADAAPAPTPAPVAAAPAPIATAPAPAPIATAPAPAAAAPAPAAAAPAPAAAAPASEESVERVLGILRNLKIPAGYQREMIIIGNRAYSVSVKEQVFLGKKKVEKTLEPIGSLPEGVFFADGYAPRVLVEDGSVLAIEFLKKEAGEYGDKQEVEHEPRSLKAHIKGSSPSDLVSSLGFKTKQ